MSDPAGKVVQRKPKAPRQAAEHTTTHGVQPPEPSFFGQQVLKLQSQAGNHAVQGLLGGGVPLAGPLREEMEQRFGADFNRVRLHIDPPSSSALGAKAYTHGQDIVFNQGRFAPETTEGKRLLAHELAHVIQQSRGGPKPTSDANEKAAKQAAGAFVCSSQGLIDVKGAASFGIAKEEDKEQPPKTIEEYEKRVGAIHRITTEDLSKKEKAKLTRNRRESRIGLISTREGKVKRLEQDREALGIASADDPTPITTRFWKEQGRQDRQGALRRLAYEKDPKIIPPQIAADLRLQLKQLESLMVEGRYDETKHLLRLPKGYVLGHWEGDKFVRDTPETPAREGFDYNNSRVITVEENRREEGERREKANIGAKKPNEKAKEPPKAIPPIIRKKDSLGGISSSTKPPAPKATAAATPLAPRTIPGPPLEPGGNVHAPATGGKTPPSAPASPAPVPATGVGKPFTPWSDRRLQKWNKGAIARTQRGFEMQQRRAEAKAAGWTMAGAALGDALEYLNDEGIRRRVAEEKVKLKPAIAAYQEQHPQDGVLLAIRIDTWDPVWRPPDARTTRSFVGLTPQYGGKTKDEAIARWMNEPKYIQGSGEGTKMDVDFLWIEPGATVPLSKIRYINGRYGSDSDANRILVFQFEDNGSFRCEAYDPKTGVSFGIEVVKGWAIGPDGLHPTMCATFRDPRTQVVVTSEFMVFDADSVQEHWVSSMGTSGDNLWRRLLL